MVDEDNTHICPLVRRVATTPSNIPFVRMSLLTLALTDKSASCEDKKQLAERFEFGSHYHVEN